MKKVNLFFSVLATVFFLAVLGCGDGDDGVADVAGCGGDTLCVGALIPDPSLQSLAVGLADAARTAETDIANAGGKIELYIKEVGDCNDLSVPRTAAKELIDMGVDAIVGHICSGVSNSILGGGDEAAVSGIENVIMISPSNTASGFSNGDRIYDYYFRTAPSDVSQAALLAKEIKETSTAQSYVVYRNDTWGKLLKDDLLANGISAPDMIMEYNREDEDDTIASMVEEFLDDRGDINVVVLAFGEAEAILKKLLSSEKISKKNRYYLADGYYSELVKLKDELEELGQGGLENPETLAQLFHSNSSGFLATGPDSYEYDDTDLADAQKTFQSQLDLPDGSYGPNTYDAVILLALAHLSADSAEPDALAGALVEVSGPPGRCISYEDCAMRIQEDADINYQGLSGTIDFDDKGDIQVAVYKILSYFDRTIEERGNVVAP